MIVEQLVEWMSSRRNRSSRRKPAPVLLCPPQVPHDLNGARTRATKVGSQRITIWATTRPTLMYHFTIHFRVKYNFIYNKLLKPKLIKVIVFVLKVCPAYDTDRYSPQVNAVLNCHSAAVEAEPSRRTVSHYFPWHLTRLMPVSRDKAWHCFQQGISR
jgi:hypothetical protein